MNAQLTSTILRNLPSYPTPYVRQRMRSLAASMDKRVAAMREVEKAEPEVVQQTLAKIKKTYPRFAKSHANGWEKCERDIELVIRNATLGMLLADPSFQDQRVLVWMRTIVRSNAMGCELLAETYGEVRRAFSERLSESAFGLMQPHLDRVVETLSADLEKRPTQH